MGSNQQKQVKLYGVWHVKKGFLRILIVFGCPPTITTEPSCRVWTTEDYVEAEAMRNAKRLGGRNSIHGYDPNSLRVVELSGVIDKEGQESSGNMAEVSKQLQERYQQAAWPDSEEESGPSMTFCQYDNAEDGY